MGRRCSVVLAWTIVVSALVGGTPLARAADFPGRAKVEPALLAALAQGGEASYLVYLQEQANLAGAYALADREARGQFVYRALKEVADRTQAPLRAYLTAEVQAGRAKEVQAFFSANALAVTSTEATVRRVAAFPEVARIIRAPVVSIPDPLPGAELPTVNAVEWNIARIRAPEVWAAGFTGQGVVVASIDTGAQFNHPALVNQYRGNLGGGQFDHNYNWFDPSLVCGSPSLAPCDNNNHGTHVTGTMVGDDGGANQIGVAPGAKWIACKGCETSSCSSAALLACGDWVLAPRNLNGLNPDPAKRPHVVNNSWGGGSGDPWYRPTVQAWRAAGILPAFANGNGGPNCNTSSSPGDYPESFSSGATTSTDAIASFSGRGPSAFGVTKPDIASPGANIRSSISNPPNGYAAFNGTSMASPHTAGTVALLWSRYAGLVRDIPNTEKKLRPAAEIFNTTQGCGGDGPTTHPNNVFGWGRNDAYQTASIFNIYNDRSAYGPAETTNLQISLVNPLASTLNADLYVAMALPGGLFLFFPSFGTTPVPLAANVPLPGLFEVFDIPIYSFASWWPGTTVWLAVLVPPGGDFFNPAVWLSWDYSWFFKN